MDRNPSTLKFPASLYMYCVRCTRYQVGLPLWQEIQPVKTCTYKRCRSFSHVVLLLAVHNQRWGGGVNPCPTPTKGVQLSFQAASPLHTTLKIMEYSSESVPYNWLYIIQHHTVHSLHRTVHDTKYLPSLRRTVPYRTKPARGTVTWYCTMP